MPASRLAGARILLSPREPLVGGGAAEAFEQQLQRLVRDGYRNLVVDLADVTAIDSAGIRALVRGTYQRTPCRRHAAAGRGAAAGLRGPRALASERHLRDARVGRRREDGGVAVGRDQGGGRWHRALRGCWCGRGFAGRPSSPASARPSRSALTGGTTERRSSTNRFQPFIELGKLVAAALIGILVTAVHQPSPRDRARQPIDGAGADAALRVRRADDDHHRQLAGARVRHRRRREHHQVPNAGGRSRRT